MRGRSTTLIVGALATILASLAFAGAAPAHQLFPYEFKESFDGQGSTAGAFTAGLSKVAINESNGRVYVLDSHADPVCCGATNWLSQFNAAGEAQNFSGLAGVSSLSVGIGGLDMVFDNTGHHEGLWVFGSAPNGNILDLNEDGTERINGGAGNNYAACGLGIDPEGFIYQGSTQWVYRIDPTTGFPTPEESYLSEQQPCHTTFDSQGYAYLEKSTNFNEGGPGLYKYYKGQENITCCLGVEGFGDQDSLQVSHIPTEYSTADLTDDDIYAVENGSQITQYSPQGAPITTFGLPEGGFPGLEGAEGVAINQATKDVYVPSRAGGSSQVDVFHRGAPVTVPDVSDQPAGHPDGVSGVLKGIVNPDGVATTECKFEWGKTTGYGNGIVPCDQGEVFSGSTDQQVTHEVKSLTIGQTYHYRLSARNANGHWSYSPDRTFEASTPPTVAALLVDRINTDGARFGIEINPHGGYTKYHFEVGTEDCASHPCTQVPVDGVSLEENVGVETVSQTTAGLQPNTTYHLRLVAESEAGTSSASTIFHTYPSPPSTDRCANAHVRQQTSAYLLPDCRAYELVSAANAGGFDVASDLVPGQAPFAAYPAAHNRVLYGLHFGSIPGIAGGPTNFGVDPYVAERGEEGWVTRYVGLPAGGMADVEPFGSPLLGADEQLNSFAFGGDGICDPCFAGLGSNLPVRRDGSPAEPGMAGSLSPGEAAPAGVVSKYLSADGSHLVFGSTSKFEEGGAEGALTLYERDLDSRTTELVSTDSTGATISGAGLAALDVSSDGSRVVFGKQVSVDGAGNAHYHLYVHLGGVADSVDLTPGVGSSALFDGMTADGSRVFFTTTAHLLPAEDTDASADIYEAEVDGGGSVTLRLVSVKSTGAPSNDDSCTPPGEPDNWNAASGEGKCDAVAFAGGAGVAAGDGTFYFVSPEQLEGGEGIANQPNLYVVKPGDSPRFVDTIDSSLAKGQPVPESPVVKGDLTGTNLGSPESVAVDQSNGDVYVDETGSGVARFHADGTPHDFAEQPANEISTTLAGTSESAIAVDNSGGNFDGDLYVASYGNPVKVFSPDGKELGALDGSGTSVGSFAACGVAVDQSNGAVYIGDYNGHIWRYMPTGSAPITDADYTVTGIETTGMSPCQVAADSAGHVYGISWSNGPIKEFDASLFAAGTPPGASGTQVDAAARAATTDPSTNELYVNEGSQVVVFSPTGERVRSFGSGSISNSRGVAVAEGDHHAYAPNSTAIAEFGYQLPPYAPIDNPGVVHGVKQAATHSYADFQVTPDGRYAAFTSGLPLTGAETLGHSEIYRYDSESETTECASCTITLAPAKFDTFLSPYGINLSEDGRVFFTSSEGLVLSDTNEKLDAYEWSGGTELGLLSTGRSLSDSKLLSASEDGTDAFFFTRDVLVPSDENGGSVKIYDAREGGGYPQSAEPKACAASDECHGPGSEPPPPPNINSLTGAGPEGSSPTTRCKKGFLRRQGKCVKKHHKRHHDERHRKRVGSNG